MEKAQSKTKNWQKALWNYGECSQQKLINYKRKSEKNYEMPRM